MMMALSVLGADLFGLGRRSRISALGMSGRVAFADADWMGGAGEWDTGDWVEARAGRHGFEFEIAREMGGRRTPRWHVEMGSK